MKQILDTLYNYETLSSSEAYDAMMQIGSGHCNEAQVSGLLSAYIMRKPAPEELQGFLAAIMDLCKPIELEADAIDIVGTGGDGKNSFNISTLSAIVVAAAGYKVVKHGNYGASSICGSSNVLEQLGYRFIDDESALQRQLDKSNLCFLHAPLFHPALKRVGQLRRDLGFRTIFNLLGPLVNPARPRKQLLGVCTLEIARTYNYLLQDSGTNYRIVHSLDGYDEISLTGPFKVISAKSEAIYEPSDIGLRKVLPVEIENGGNVEESAFLVMNILNGKGTKAQNDVVIANSGFAIQIFQPDKQLAECMDIAREALLSLKALNTIKQLIVS